MINMDSKRIVIICISAVCVIISVLSIGQLTTKEEIPSQKISESEEKDVSDRESLREDTDDIVEDENNNATDSPDTEEDSSETQEEVSDESTSADSDTDEISGGSKTDKGTDTLNSSKTTNDTYTKTMYDYTKAGMKSATGKVISSDYISVKEYGIEANTNKDVSSKVIEAIYDATLKGKYLYFPEGTYYIKNVRISDVDNVRICGAGEKTILKTANDASGSKWDIAMGIFNADGVIVRNLVFDGNNKNVDGNLEVGVIQLRIDNCDNAKVYGCRFQDNNSGNVNIVGEAKNLEIFYCDFLNSDCSILTSPGYINKGYLCNNFIDGEEWIYSEPISIYYADDLGYNTDVIISGNDIRNHDNGAGGIFITHPSKNISILNNYLYKCGAGIGSGSQRQVETSTQGPTHITVKGNVIDTPTWHGFGLLYADNWTITDNEIKNVTDGFAFYLDQCDNNDIRNNKIDGSRIYEENCSGNNISDNE